LALIPDRKIDFWLSIAIAEPVLATEVILHSSKVTPETLSKSLIHSVVTKLVILGAYFFKQSGGYFPGRISQAIFFD